MLGKTSGQIRREDESALRDLSFYISFAALLLAIAGIFTPNASFLGNLNPSSCTNLFNARTILNSGQTADSISAYDLWLALGNAGSVQDFLDSLVGDKGNSGFNGANGESAFEVWLKNGNEGSEADFLASLAGQQGEMGPAGLSAYELWLSLGNQGSLSDFANSLVGQPGATGATGAAGANGVCTIGVGYYGSFWDETSQPISTGVTPIVLGKSGSKNGVSVAGSQVTFANAGTYNVAFSAQLVNVGGSKLTASIWLRQNGQNLPYTNTNIAMTHSNDEYVAAWNFFVDVNAGDTVELVAHSTAPGLVVLAQPESTSGTVTIPGIPSIVFTVNQVR